MDSGLRVSHDDMMVAISCGEAKPLATTVTWLTRYQDAWWVVYEGGWLKVTDELTIADINQSAERIPNPEPVRGK